MSLTENNQQPASGSKGRFLYLFVCQVAFLVLFPYFDRPGLSMVFFRLFGAAAFFSGVYAVSERRAQWITALLLAIPASLLNALFALRPDQRLTIPTLIFTMLFVVFTAVFLLRAVLRSGDVTYDTICGS